MHCQFNQFLLHHYFQLPDDLLFYRFNLQFLRFDSFGIAIELFATGDLPEYVRDGELEIRNWEFGTWNQELGTWNWELGIGGGEQNGLGSNRFLFCLHLFHNET